MKQVRSEKSRWLRPREEMEIQGCTLITRSRTARGIHTRHSVWDPSKHDLIQAFRSMKPATVWPVRDSDGPAYIVIEGLGPDAKKGLEEYLVGYRDVEPTIDLTGEPSEAPTDARDWAGSPPALPGAPDGAR